MSLKQEQADLIIEKNYSLAREFEEEIKNLDIELKKNQEISEIETNPEAEIDFDTLIRCLTIAEALLLSPKITELNPALSTLKDNLIIKLIIHNNNAIKAKALKCYALCCLVDRKSAEYGIHIFSMPVSLC